MENSNIKVRNVVYLSEKMNSDIEIMAEEMGISKPDFIRLAIADKVLNYKRTVDALDNTMQALLQNLPTMAK